MMTKAEQIEMVVQWLRKHCPEGALFSDSREVAKTEKEALFFSYHEGDSKKYIANAIENGAKAILYEEASLIWPAKWQIPHLPVKGLKELAGPIAAAYYGQPSKSMFVVAVTGTNGKTSCTQWLGATLSRLGEKTAVIGTLGVVLFEKGEAKKAEETGYTTPDQVQLQRKLAELAQKEVACIAIEASSIGIEEGRLNGLDIDMVLFTNFTRDHLDYHKNMQAYESAKKKLFDWPGLKNIVLNLDDSKARAWLVTLKEKLPVLGYTILPDNAANLPLLQGSKIQTQVNGTRFYVSSDYGQAQINTRLIGNFNVSNVLGVLGILLLHGANWKDAVSSISELMPPPGRMQLLGGKNTPLIVIDYAHTPDALEKGLETLRQVANDKKGALRCVFGCGGDRDKGKRKDMGRVSELADHVIVTSDNPRSEKPSEIIEEIVSGMQSRPMIIEDRASAILLAVKQSSENDVIFLAGKGHETYQEINGVKHPFCDADHATLALAVFETMQEGTL